MEKEKMESIKLKRVNFGTRVGAFVVDFIFMSIILTFFGIIVSSIKALTFDKEFGTDMSLMGFQYGVPAVMFAIFVIYYTVEAFTGYTLGKLAIGIRIADVEGARADWDAYIFRFLLKNSYWVLALIGGIIQVEGMQFTGKITGGIIFIGCFFILSAKRQALHDMLTDTAVYRRSDLLYKSVNDTIANEKLL